MRQRFSSCTFGEGRDEYHPPDLMFGFLTIGLCIPIAVTLAQPVLYSDVEGCPVESRRTREVTNTGESLLDFNMFGDGDVVRCFGGEGRWDPSKVLTNSTDPKSFVPGGCQQFKSHLQGMGATALLAGIFIFSAFSTSLIGCCLSSCCSYDDLAQHPILGPRGIGLLLQCGSWVFTLVSFSFDFSLLSGSPVLPQRSISSSQLWDVPCLSGIDAESVGGQNIQLRYLGTRRASRPGLVLLIAWIIHSTFLFPYLVWYIVYHCRRGESSAEIPRRSSIPSANESSRGAERSRRFSIPSADSTTVTARRRQRACEPFEREEARRSRPSFANHTEEEKTPPYSQADVHLPPQQFAVVGSSSLPPPSSYPPPPPYTAAANNAATTTSSSIPSWIQNLPVSEDVQLKLYEAQLTEDIFPTVTEADLRDELKIPLGPRKVLLAEIERRRFQT